jgi:TolB-like protein/Tfp pilus assembly protein PilF
MAELLARLKQRKLVQWALAYLAGAWAVLQALGLAADSYDWPHRVMQIAFAAIAVGFAIALVLAWYHGEKGRQRVSSAELLLIALVLAVGGGLLWRYARVAPAATGTVAARGADGAQGNPRTMVSGASAKAVPTDSVPAKSIAVLPFVNMSGDPKNDYFSDGITEEILNALAQVPKLKVAARTSAFAFKGKEEDLRKVGEVLDVATVLEGSVQRSGDEVRITAQLIDTRTGYHLWSEKYDRKLISIFAVEDEISKAIADKLRVQLVGGDNRALAAQTRIDPRAHDLYLRAIAAIACRGPALKDAVLLLQQATARDPDYASAWAALSQAYELLPWYELAEWPGSLASAEQSARRALALDPQSGEAHAALANVLRDKLDYASADREYRRALALNPGSSEIRNQYAQLLNAIGASDAMLHQERSAISLDPLAPNPRYMLGFELVIQHRYPEAAAEFEKVLEQTPDYAYARFHLALTHLYEGHDEEALKIARAAALQAGQDPATIEILLRACTNPALRPEALKRVVGINRIEIAKLDDLSRAFWYSQLGERDQALASLQTWVRTAPVGQRFNGVRWLRLPTFDPIRDDPRFKAVLAKLGLPYRPDTAATQ